MNESFDKEVKAIVQRIRESIEKNSFSYGDLEKITGIPKSSLQRYATGQVKRLSTDTIEKIADACNVSPQYIMGWEKEEQPDDTGFSEICCYCKDIKLLLKERRSELGLTMKQVAEKVGVSESTVSRWESGDIANMTRDKVVALANALKLRPATLMGLDVTKQPAELGDPQTEIFIKLLKRMTPEQKQVLTDYMIDLIAK